MLTLEDILLGVVLPAAASLAVLVFGLAMWRRARERGARERGARERGWVWPLAIAVGFAGGLVGIIGWPALPPLDSTEWLFYIAFAAAAMAVLDQQVMSHRSRPRQANDEAGTDVTGPVLAYVRPPEVGSDGISPALASSRAAVAIALCAASAFCLFRPLVAHTWEGPSGAGWLGRSYRGDGRGVGVAGCLDRQGARSVADDHRACRRGRDQCDHHDVWESEAGADRRRPDRSMRGGGGCGDIWPRDADAQLCRGPAFVSIGLLACGYFYANVTTINAVLLWGALLTPWAAEHTPLRGMGGAWRGTVRVGLAVVPVAIALFLAGAQFARDLREQAELGY